MNLFKKVLDEEPRERAGSISYNRFDYQQNWALCKILDLHASSIDYLVCFDFHDDILVMDSSSSPQKLSFYQIKTKDKGNWSKQDLTRTKKGKDGKTLNSFLGKLYYNSIVFKDSTEKLTFVSNASFKIELKDKSQSLDKKIIQCDNIESNVIDEINSKLKKELDLIDKTEFEKITVLKVAELTIENHEELTITHLAKFIEKNFPATKYQIFPIYKSLFGELKRKAKYEKKINNLDELKMYKAICKSDFDYYLKTSVLDKRESFYEKCKRIEDRLNSENISFSFVKIFQEKILTIEIDRMNGANKLFTEVSKLIQRIIKETYPSGYDTKLFDCMEKVFSKFQIKSKIKNALDDNYIKTLILFELYEN